MESEEFRCNIIDANWTPGQLKELLNSYINMIQIELDRFIESIRFMNDYYLGITTGMPSDDDQCKEEALPKYQTIRKTDDYIHILIFFSYSTHIYK